MLRSFFSYLAKAAWAQNLFTNWGLAWKVASRFIAGTNISDAMKTVKELNKLGINVTLDQLGEHTSSAEEAIASAKGILDTLNEIQKEKVIANVSIKLTQIGMGTDDEVCKQNLINILQTAKNYNNFIRIDIEDTPYTDQTISLLNEMHASGFGPETVGMAIQSYLYRSEDDMRKLLENGTRFRLVKGAYQEPANLAYPKKSDVDANYDNLTSILIDAAKKFSSRLSPEGFVPPIPAMATHDEKRIDFAKQYAAKVGVDKEQIEFQMLYGIRRDIQASLNKEGYPVRVYVPFGTHWYPYFMRRLAERPANIWFFVSNFFK